MLELFHRCKSLTQLVAVRQVGSCKNFDPSCEQFLEVVLVCASHTTSLAGWHHCILLPSTASCTCLKLHVMLSFVAVLGF